MVEAITILSALPILCFLVLDGAVCLILELTPVRRLYTLPIVGLLSILSFNTINYLKWPSGLSTIWGLGVLVSVFHFTSLLYVEQYTPQAFYKKKDKAREGPNESGWPRTYNICNNPRMIEVTSGDSSVRWRRGRSRSHNKPFSGMRVARLLLCILVHHFVIEPALHECLRSSVMDDYAPSRTAFIRRLPVLTSYTDLTLISAREAKLRCIFTFCSFWLPYLLIETIHVVPALICLYVLRIDSPAEWPPLFGDLREAYTISRFWSRFWHSLHLQPYMSYARLLTSMLPSRLTRNSEVRRVVTNLWIFTLSGSIHELVNWQTGDKCTRWRDMWFYLVNFLAVLVEGVVLGYFRRRNANGIVGMKPRGTEDTSSVPPSTELLKRCIGYVWVCGFFFWIVPKVYYTKVHCAIEQQIVEALAMQGRHIKML